MSIQAVAWALEQHIPNSGLKLVLIALCNHVETKTFTWELPRRQIEREASMSRSSVKRHLKKLAELGIIEFSTNCDPSGRQRWNTYRVVTDPDEQKEIAARQATLSMVDSDDGEGVNLNPSPLDGEPVDNLGKTGGEGVSDGPGEGSASGPPEGAVDGPPIKKPSQIPSKEPSSAPPRASESVDEAPPPRNAAGHYIITPDRPEWDAFMATMPERTVRSFERTGRIVTVTRWPPDHSHSNPETEK